MFESNDSQQNLRLYEIPIWIEDKINEKIPKKNATVFWWLIVFKYLCRRRVKSQASEVQTMVVLAILKKII